MASSPTGGKRKSIIFDFHIPTAALGTFAWRGCAPPIYDVSQVFLKFCRNRRKSFSWSIFAACANLPTTCNAFITGYPRLQHWSEFSDRCAVIILQNISRSLVKLRGLKNDRDQPSVLFKQKYCFAFQDFESVKVSTQHALITDGHITNLFNEADSRYIIIIFRYLLILKGKYILTLREIFKEITVEPRYIFENFIYVHKNLEYVVDKVAVESARLHSYLRSVTLLKHSVPSLW